MADDRSPDHSDSTPGSENLGSALSAQAAEEARGKIRWLRPEFQNPDGTPEQTELDLSGPENQGLKPKTSPKKRPWPKTLPEQVRAVREVLEEAGQPVTAETVVQSFIRARKDKVVPILETLVTVGRARLTGDGRFVGGG